MPEASVFWGPPDSWAPLNRRAVVRSTKCVVQIAFSRHSYNCMQQNPHLIDMDVGKLWNWEIMNTASTAWNKSKVNACQPKVFCCFCATQLLDSIKRIVKITSKTASRQTPISTENYVLTKCCAAEHRKYSFDSKHTRTIIKLNVHAVYIVHICYISWYQCLLGRDSV
jgi:hypothetical protein